MIGESPRIFYKNDTHRDARLSWRSLILWVESVEDAINGEDKTAALRALKCVREKADQLAMIALRTSEQAEQPLQVAVAAKDLEF